MTHTTHIIEMDVRHVANGHFKIIRLCILTGVTVGVYLLIRYVLVLVAPFILSYILYRMLRPVARWLERVTPLPERVTGVIVMGVLIGVITYLCWCVGRYCWQTVNGWLVQRASWPVELMESCHAFCDRFDGWMHYSEGTCWQFVLQAVNRWQATGQKDFMVAVSVFAKSFFKGLGRLTVTVLIGLLGAVLLIRHQYALLNGLKESNYYKEMSYIFDRVMTVILCFLRTQGIIMALIGGICIAGLWLLRLRHPIAAGIGIALFDAFPILGSGMILVPWAVLRLVEGSFGQMLGLLLLYGITVVVREILEPRLMGGKLQIHPFYMLMAMVIGAQIFGFWGIFTGPLGLVLIKEIMKQIDDMV